MTKLEQAAREVVRQHSMECLSDKAITALREALAEQAEQEPVAWGMKASNGAFFTITPEEHDNNGEGLHNIPLYAAPVQSVSAKPLCWAHWKSPDYAEDPAFLVTVTEKPTGWQTQSANWFPLYAAPVRTKDLTDDEVMQTYTNFNLNELGEQSFMIGFARAVIAAYKEKNK